MPSKSQAQARTMRAAMHDKEFAKKVGIPQSVATDFVRADQAKGKKHMHELPGHIAEMKKHGLHKAE